MAEAGIVAYGAAIGVGLYLAVLTFSLRQRRPHGPEMETYFKGQTETPEPAKEEPTPEPAKEEPTPEPAKEEPTPEPAKEEPKTEEK